MKKNHSIKLLLINLDNRGILHYAIDLANNYSGHDIEIYALGYEGLKEIKNSNCKVFTIPNKGYYKLFKKVQELIKDNKVDVAHFTGFHPIYSFISKYINKNGIPTITTIHDAKMHPLFDGNLMKFIKRKFIVNRFSINSLVKNSSEIIALSTYVAGQISALYHREATVIPLSCDIERFSDETSISNEFDFFNSATSIKLLFFGAVSKYKGVEKLISACEILYDKKIDFRLIIAGKGGDYPLIIPKKLHDNIVWLNRFIDDREIPLLFHKSDLVVLPYTEVSQSGVLTLAFGYKKPVIATNMGSFSEFVEPNHNGLLVHKDSILDIAEAIIFFSENPTTIKDYGENAYLSYKSKLNWNSSISTYISLFNNIIN